MNKHPIFPRSSLLGLAIVAPLAAVALAACGGGDAAGQVTGAQLSSGSALSRGTLTGFGSIYVDGIEYDDTNATITDDDGNAQPESALKLGMQVELTGQDQAGTATMGSAGTIVFNSDIVGAVTAIDTTAQTITILGQTIDVNTLTAWDPALTGGLAGLAAGTVIKVYSLYDATTGRYEASRVEGDASATAWKLRGMVSALDTTAKTYQVGSTVIDYSGVATPPATLADGLVVVAELQTTAGASGWLATGLQLRNAGVPGDHVKIHVRGLIATETSPTSFTLEGWPVDASGATFPGGQSTIVAGASVQVDGIMTNGVLVAGKVSLQQPGSNGGLDFELHGPIQTIDTTAQTFVLRGQTVSYAGSVSYTGGDASSLVVGAKVLVQGKLSTDGSAVQAVDVQIDQ